MKTSLSLSELGEVCGKLAKVAQSIRRWKKEDIFVGIFSYEAGFSSQSREEVLDVVNAASDGVGARIINHVALGDSLFVKYWKYDPDAHRGVGPKPRLRPPRYYEGDYRHWHLYKMQDMAYGYFIHNALVSMTPGLSIEEENVYFPEDGKESMRVREVQFKPGTQR